MKMFLNMSHYYPDGYKNDYTSCIDTPIGVSAGYYHYENYFYYVFQLAAGHNWSDISLNDWQAFKGGILGKLGLELVPMHIDDDAGVIPAIKEKLNQSIPVMMPSKYKAIFYFYLSGNPDAAHFILVSGYDSKRQLIQIRDANHLYESGIWGYFDPEPRGLFPLFVNEDILLDIWVKSNRFFAQEGGPLSQDFYCFDSAFHQQLYSLEPKGAARINSYQELMQDFFQTCSVKKNRFVAAVEQYNELLDRINGNATGFEIAFFKCFHVIFGVIGRWLATFPEEPKVQAFIQRLDEFKTEYMEAKNRMVYGFIQDAKSNKHYPDDELRKISSNISSLDEELFSFVACAMDDLYK